MKQLQLTKKEFLKELTELMNEEEEKDYKNEVSKKLLGEFGPESMVETVVIYVEPSYKYTKKHLIFYTLEGFVVLKTQWNRLNETKSIDEEIILGIKEMMSMESKLKKEDEEKLIFILDRLKLQVLLCSESE